jgi:hypothetical protein
MNASALLTKGFCRCCISTTANLIPMQNGSFVFQSNILNISDVYVALSGIEHWIPELDNEPSICEMCTTQLQNVYIFLEQIKVADAALRTMFLQQPSTSTSASENEVKNNQNFAVAKKEVDVEPIETYQISSDDDSQDAIKVEEYKIMNFNMSNTFNCSGLQSTVTKPKLNPYINDTISIPIDAESKVFNVHLKQEHKSPGKLEECTDASFICDGCNRKYECKKKLLAHLYEYHFPDLTDD